MKYKRIALFTLLSALSISLTGCDQLRYDSYDDADLYTVIDESVVFSAEQLDIKTIDIDWGRGNLNVVTSDTGTFSFSEESNKTINEKLKARYYINGQTLYIKYADSKATYNNKLEKTATVTINQSLSVLANATYSFSLALGDLDVDSLKAKTLYMGVAYGNMHSKNLETDNCRMLCDCGKQTHENITITSKAEIKTNYGDMSLGTSSAIKGFSLDVNCVSGTLWVNTEKFPKESETFYGIHQEKDLQLDIIENYGNIEIL